MKNIIFESRHTGDFEINSILRNFFDIFFIPILNNLPSSFQKTIKKTHKSADEVIKKATSHSALEVLYSHGKMHKSRNIFQTFFRYVWFTRNNAKAVRNRLKIVKREITKEIKNRKDTGITLLSIASGSARAVVESFSNVPLITNTPVSLNFLDKSIEAISYSRSLAKNLDGVYACRWITDTANSFPKYFPNNKPNIVEMVGLLDYFDDEKILETFQTIYNNLEEGGVLITANVIDNKERPFLERVVGWNMIYSTPEDFIRIANEAGFRSENIVVYVEPLKIHFVMVAHK